MSINQLIFVFIFIFPFHFIILISSIYRLFCFLIFSFNRLEIIFSAHMFLHGLHYNCFLSSTVPIMSKSKIFVHLLSTEKMYALKILSNCQKENLLAGTLFISVSGIGMHQFFVASMFCITNYFCPCNSIHAMFHQIADKTFNFQNVFIVETCYIEKVFSSIAFLMLTIVVVSFIQTIRLFDKQCVCTLSFLH